MIHNSPYFETRDEAAEYLDSLASDERVMSFTELDKFHAAVSRLLCAGEMRCSHTAARPGYESRKTCGHIEFYSGKFGEGYIHIKPRWDTTRMVYLTYYLWEK